MESMMLSFKKKVFEMCLTQNYKILGPARPTGGMII